ncbi:MAG: hypothetical protein ACYC4Q_09045, partial [Victivallaceae bacterium]
SCRLRKEHRSIDREAYDTPRGKDTKNTARNGFRDLLFIFIKNKFFIEIRLLKTPFRVRL